MIDALWRKAAQVANDPVLRRWLIARATRREAPPLPFSTHRPPYLDGMPLPNGVAQPAAHELGDLVAEPPDEPIELPLPGARPRLAPGEEAALFDTRFDDLETTLAVHRFAWLPVMGGAAPPSWVDALWRAWASRHSEPDDGWAWHPYTAAERAINLLDFAAREGLPGPRAETLALLVRHGHAISARLEYFGEHDTSNHLSNNGRGLYLLGLALDVPEFADLGGRIMLSEAARIFGPSGVLREGSTHYHLLLTRNYVSAWLAARRHNRPESADLARIAGRALAIARHLMLPAGLPLIGDISPDCPPDYLAGLAGGSTAGWSDRLDDAARTLVAGRMSAAPPVDGAALASDGWVRVDHGPWASLTHVPPAGWPPMPGHAHQDLGSFELHHGGERLFIDPGRGAYGDRGEAALYVDASVHNGLTIDGADPYPRNRPYYSDDFRRAVGGGPPDITQLDDGLCIAHHGFTRVAGVGRVERRWSFTDRAMRVTDRVAGRGRHRLTRRLTTPHSVDVGADGVRITTARAAFRISSDVAPEIRETKSWVAYGEDRPATSIVFSREEMLPAETDFTVELI